MASLYLPPMFVLHYCGAMVQREAKLQVLFVSAEFRNVSLCSLTWFVTMLTSVPWLILYLWLGPYSVQLYLAICLTGKEQTLT